MSVFERKSPPSPYWFIQFTHLGVTKRVSSKVLMGTTAKEQKASRQQAEQIEAQMRAEIEARANGKFTQTTLKQAVDDHFELVLKLSKPVLVAQERQIDVDVQKIPVVVNFFTAVRRLYAAFGEDRVLDDISEDMITDWRNAMLKTGKKASAAEAAPGAKSILREGLAPSSINAYLRVLSTIMTTAHEAKKLMTLPAIKMFPEAELEPKCLEDHEVEAIYTAARAIHPRYERMLQFFFNTGARKSEAFALEWKHIGLRSNGPCKVNFTTMTKNNRSRFVAIPEGLRELLLKMEAEQIAAGYTGQRVFAFKHPRNGKWIEPKAINAQITKLQDATGIEDFHLHICRHTYASRLLRRGARLIDVSQLLGHKDIETTQIYAHLEQDNLDAVTTLLNRDWAGASGAGADAHASA
jgi:integrase